MELRGFNQAELMAKGVAGRIEAPVLDKLKVVRRTRDQVELSANERRASAGRAPGERRGRLHDARARGGQGPLRRRRLRRRRLRHRRHPE
ncbi:MAG TPA: hypothetical protein VI027_02640 [Rubrobacteraceae bacterium]